MMDSSSDLAQLLTEIRDLQDEHLREYRRFAARSIEIQENAVQRQAAIAALYKRVVLVAGIVVLGLVSFLIFFVYRN